MLNVYLANMFSKIEETRKYRDNLETIHGMKVTSRWLEEKHNANVSINELAPSEYMAPAIDDIEDIDRSDVLVIFTVDGETPTRRGGRHWETGYAYGKGKKIIVCGPKENLFHFLPDVTICATWEEAKQELLKLKFARQHRSVSGYTTYATNAVGGVSGNYTTLTI